MTSAKQIQGELQIQIMSALWKLGSGTVEQVRGALPPRYQSAYTTIQTVLNRLAVRGLLTRASSGNSIVYKPAFSEAEYFSRSVEAALATASAEARDAVLARLAGKPADATADQLQDQAKEIGKRRGDGSA
jgi:predicted transcriptional regulator